MTASKKGIELKLAEEERNSMLEMVVQAREALLRFKRILKRLGVEENVLIEATGILEQELNRAGDKT